MRSVIIFLALLIGCGVAAAASADAPQRKSGLWEMKMSSGQMPGGMTIQQCVDQKSDDISKMQEPKSNCTKNVVRREGDKIVAESVCKMQGTTATTRSVFTGKFDSSYKGEIKSTYDPPLHGMRESSSTIERLRLDTYCHERFGGESEGHVAPAGSVLECSALEHGVWGLVTVEAFAVCKDQLGAQAVVVRNSAGGLACRA